METFFFTGSGGAPRSSARAAQTGPVLVLLLAGLLADFGHHDEAYASLDYGLALLTFLGAAGCIACLAYRLSLRPDPLPWARSVGLAPSPAASLIGNPVQGEDWPLLVALLLGPLVVLLAGLGGWV